jgi:hypothetical protein
MKNIHHYKQHMITVSIILMVLFFTAAFTVYKTNGTVVTAADWLRAKKERAFACGNTKAMITRTYAGSVNGSFNKEDIGPKGGKGGHEAMNHGRSGRNTDGTGCAHQPGVAIFNRRTLLNCTC